RRYVELLETQGDRVLVRGTLQEGDEIIVDGTHRLIPGQLVKPL
ncbi:MAG: efflux RND transporter periplasmic adaptor subunit, partial [Cyanobacteria bacterium P01_A01_bin.83]